MDLDDLVQGGGGDFMGDNSDAFGSIPGQVFIRLKEGVTSIIGNDFRYP